MKRKILHCAYSGMGGHAAVLFTLLDQRASDGFDHFVLFFGIEELREEFSQACTQLGVPFEFVRKRGRLAVRSHAQVLRYIRKVDPDVIMINGTSLVIPVLAGRQLSRRTWRVMVRETQANHLKTRAEKLGSWVAARFADAVVYLTEEYCSEVQGSLGMRSGSNRAHVIPNGVSIEDYKAAADLAPHPIRIAMVSRLVPIKDHRTLIEAVRILVAERNHTELKVYVVGDGPTASDLRAQVERAGMGDAIVFTGLLRSYEVASLLKTVHIYVHCTFGETMSNSILQAMAAGLPVVASDVRGVANLIRPGIDGFLVPVTNAVALADAVEGLIESPESRRFLGSNARERIESEFSRQRVAECYGALFEKLSAGRPAGDAGP